MTEEKYSVGQKRQHSDNSGPASKRAHVSDGEVQIKVLIPAGAVGALIGKGGESMRNLKNESGCRVQMSKNQEVYHGTNERICLIKGKVSSCMIVMQAILDKIRERADSSTASDVYDLKGVDRSKMVKLVVPNTSAGMVIGKSGSSIKEIRDSTGASIQVYPKANSEEAKVSLERVITVGADTVQTLSEAVLKVLEKVAADPLHAQQMDSVSKPPTFAPTSDMGSQQFDFARQQQNNSFGGMPPNYNNPANNSWQSQQSLDQSAYNQMKQQQQPYQPQQIPKVNLHGMGNIELLSFFDNLQTTLRSSGFTDANVNEIMGAMQILAKYNIMGLGLGIGVATVAQMRQNEPVMQGMQQGPPPMMQQGLPPQRFDMGPPMMGGPPVMGHPDGPMDRGDSNLVGNTGGVLIDVMSQKKNGSSDTFAASVIKELVCEDNRMDLEVPDVVCGAVLGPKARTLVEIQQTTNCKVEVHKRGVGNVNSNCRLISLTGDPKSIINGRMMIERVINLEQSRRGNASSSTGGSRGY